MHARGLRVVHAFVRDQLAGVINDGNRHRSTIFLRLGARRSHNFARGFEVHVAAALRHLRRCGDCGEERYGERCESSAADGIARVIHEFLLEDYCGYRRMQSIGVHLGQSCG